MSLRLRGFIDFLGQLPHGLKRTIYFNDRLACSRGSKPLNDLDNSCDDTFCCSKTHLDVAKWDFEVRGKCHVLRDIKSNKVKLLYTIENSYHVTVPKNLGKSKEKVPGPVIDMV